jgi:hypothetical protein
MRSVMGFFRTTEYLKATDRRQPGSRGWPEPETTRDRPMQWCCNAIALRYYRVEILAALA